ncbi:MAG: hypothetical protein ACREDR_09265 [Blastocatellia bacterium]
MGAQLGKKFIGTMLGVVLALGTFTWLATATHVKDAPASQASDTNVKPDAATSSSSQLAGSYPASDTQAVQPGSQSDPQNGVQPGYDQGYKTDYEDAQRDCQGTGSNSQYSASRTSYAATRTPYVRRGVLGERYIARRRRGHSTRNMILTIAAPAALAAGIGGIAGGGKGAGIGALLGGGGGALYYLIKHRKHAQ